MIRFTAMSLVSVAVGAMTGALVGAFWAYRQSQLSQVTTKEA